MSFNDCAGCSQNAGCPCPPVGAAGNRSSLFTIWTATQDAVGSEMSMFRQGGGVAAAWPVANSACLIPFRCWGTRTARKMFYTATLAVGNVDMGIYDKAFNRLVSFGSVAAAIGTNFLDIADTSLAVADESYAYMAFAIDTAAGTGITRWVWGTSSRNDAAGIVTAAASFPLPATITPDAVAAYDTFPRIGLSYQTVI